MADLKRDLLLPDRLRWWAQVQDEAPLDFAWKEHLKKTALESEAAGIGPDASQRLLERQLSDTSIILCTHFAPMLKRDPEKLAIASIIDDEVSASLLLFSDSSGLVAVADGVISLVGYLAHVNSLGCASRIYEPGVLRAVRQTWRATTGTMQHREDLATMLLRYHIDQKRFFGLGGKLAIKLTSRAESYSAFLVTLATMFVVAHEAAHFVLGHQAKPSTTVLTNEVADDRPTLEMAADRLAFEVVGRYMATQSECDVWRGDALLGAFLVFKAIAIYEDTFFLRRCRSHPPAQTRWQNLLRHSQTGYQDKVESFDFLDRVVARSSDLSRSFSPDNWHVLAEGRLAFGTGPEYLSGLAVLDRLIQLLEAIDTTYGLNIRSTGITNERPEMADVFCSLDVETRRCHRIYDRSESLTFFSTIDALMSGSVLASAGDDTSRRAVAITIATLLAPHLSDDSTSKEDR